MKPGDTVTIITYNGKTLPAWNEPTCTTRWAGLDVASGTRGIVTERCPRLDDPEVGAEWWIVQVDEQLAEERYALYVPCEIHDHLVLTD